MKRAMAIILIFVMYALLIVIPWAYGFYKICEVMLWKN